MFFLMYLYFLILFNFAFCQQEYHPLKYNYTILEVGKQITETINPREIFIFQFESPFISNFFYCHSNQGDPLMYGYYTKDIETFTINENDLSSYVSFGLFDLPVIVESFSYLPLKIFYANNFISKNQYIIIVYCSSDQECNFSILYDNDDSKEINLIENEPIADSFTKNTFVISVKTNEPISIIVSSICYTGLINYSITVNNTKIKPFEQIVGQKRNYVINIDSNSIIKLKPSSTETGFYVLQYATKKEITTHSIRLAITDVHSIKLNEIQNIHVSKSVIEESSSNIMVHIKSENCKLKFNNVSEEVEAKYSNDGYCYLFIFKTPNNYYFQVEIDQYEEEDNKNENDYCTYYTYTTNINSTYSIIGIEGVTYRSFFFENFNSIVFTFPFMILGSYSNLFIIESKPQYPEKYFVKITVNDITESTIITRAFDNSHFFLSSANIKVFCSPYVLCRIKVEVISLIKNSIDLQIKAKRNVPYYIEKNKIVNDYIIPSYTRIFYTNVKKGDKGRIKLFYTNRGMQLQYKIVDKYKDLEITKNWKKTIDYFRTEETYEIGNQCDNGCFLLVKLQSTETSTGEANTRLIKYSLLINNDNSLPIDAPENQKIKGQFDYSIFSYTFSFTINSINQFQIVLGGTNVNYQIINTNSTVLCCDNFNITYTPQGKSIFVDNKIGEDETKYDITIRIIATTSNPDPYLSSYEITVIPFRYSQYPIYYVNDNSGIDCYTGKDHDRIYLIYERNKQESNDEFSVYVANGAKISVRVLISFYYERLSQTHREKEFKDTIVPEGYGSLIIKPVKETVAALIMITTDKDTKTTVFVNNKFSFTPNYLIPFQSSLISGGKVNLWYKTTPTIFSNYTYVLEIENIKGTGQFSYKKGQYYHINGKKTILFDKAHLLLHNIYTITGSTDLIALVSFYMRRKESFTTEIVSPYNNNNHFLYYMNPFPLFYIIKRPQDLSTLSVKCQYVYSDFGEDVNAMYNYSNLEIKGYYVNEENEVHNTSAIMKKVNKLPLVLITNENNTQYDYLIIKIEEKEKTINWTSPNIKFNIQPSIYTQAIELVKYKYTYLTLNSSQLLLLSNIDKILYIEVASCSNKKFSYSFTNPTSGELINETLSSITEEKGKNIITLNSTTYKENKVLFNISINSNENSNDNLFILKYTDNYDKHFEFELNSKYDEFESTIFSNWDIIRKESNAEYILNPMFYYYLYEKNSNYKSQYSICSMAIPIYSNSTTQTKLEWHNDTMDEEGYENIVIAYFSIDDEEYLIALNPVDIPIKRNGYKTYWFIVIFSLIIILVVYGTYRLYKEVRNKANEEEDNYETENGQEVSIMEINPNE